MVWALERQDWRFLRWAAAGLVASIGVLVALRLLIPSDNAYSLGGELQRVSAQYAPTFSAGWQRFVAGTIGTWGLLLPLAVLQLFHRPRLAASPAFIVLYLGSLAQIVIATNVERTVVYAFPVVIAAAAAEIEYLAARYHFSRWAIWLPVLLLELSWWAWFAGFYSFAVLVSYTIDQLDRLQPMEVMLGLTALIMVVGAGYSLAEAVRGRSSRRTPTPAQESADERVPAPALAPTMPRQSDATMDR